MLAPSDSHPSHHTAAVSTATPQVIAIDANHGAGQGNLVLYAEAFVSSCWAWAGRCNSKKGHVTLAGRGDDAVDWPGSIKCT